MVDGTDTTGNERGEEGGKGLLGGLTRNFSEGTGREVVTARGTSDGLVLRLDNTVGIDALRKNLWDFMESRRHFVEGNEVILEWLADKPEDSFVAKLQLELSRDFGVTFKAGATPKPVAKTQGAPSSGKTPSLFDGIEAIGYGSKPGADAKRAAGNAAPGRVATGGVWDDADTRMVYGTLRSGQKIETEHSVVVFGDVNSGAEVVAGGDVVVLGCLRGTAHAGAYDETGGGRVIFSLDLRPTQLRIGSVISRGSSSDGNAGAEVARIDGAMICVESYQTKGAPFARVRVLG